MKHDEYMKEYMAAAHAMQSGVAMDLEDDPDGSSPKHLRVGVNSAHVSQAALTTLLVKKGVFTWDEYRDEVVAAMKREVKRYEELLSERHKVEVRLA